ncbi:MAG: LysR family transcriptional regulator [Myxococcales bacterium]|nr:LysR family transcriptional regulator [Myxococcales bacterium]
MLGSAVDRALRLTRFWNWLPAFRAVAETEHLPTAARLLHVTPSALSRSVRQLEDALGQALFVRRNRALRLTPAGREVLAAVREAMRGLDDRLGRAGDAAAREPVRIAGPSPWVVALALASAGDAVVDHHAVPESELAARLLRGQVDLAVTTRAHADDRLAIARLGAVRQVVAGSARRRRGEPRFAVWTGGADGWPAERPRTVALTSPDLDAVLQACATTALVAAVPAVLARARGLARVAGPALAPTALYLVRRPPLASTPSPLDQLAARIIAAAPRLLG